MQTRLSRILSDLPPKTRLAARQRIEMIADHRARALEEKYGRALAVSKCRRKLLASLKDGATIRHHIWSLVYRRLHPPAARRDNLKPGGFIQENQDQ